MMMTMMQWLKPWALTVTRVALAVCATSALAGPVAERVQSQSVLRVCVWPDYYGVTYRHPRTQQLGVSTSTCLPSWLETSRPGSNMWTLLFRLSLTT